MSGSHCARSWEAEAARDGRLEAPALTSHELHVQHCARCAHERRGLERLATALRADKPHGDLELRRVRQRVMAAMNQRALGHARGSVPRTFFHARGSEPRTLFHARGSEPRTLFHARGSEPRTLGRWLTRERVVVGLLFASLVGLGWFVKARLGSHAPLALQLAPERGTRFVHERRDALEYVRLDEGALSINFNRGMSAGLIVRVPDGEIRDLGTVFRVVVRSGTTTEISVKAGAVVFRPEDQPDVLVSAGEVFLRAPRPPRLPGPLIDAPAPPARPPASSDASAETDPPQPQPAQRRAKTKSLHRGRLTSDDAHTARSGELQDLAYLRLLALLQEGRNAEARVAAQEYLSGFPDGFRRAEVERIAAAAAR